MCSEYLTKGSPVFVEGRLQSRSWETPDGQKRSTLEVVAQNIQFLSRKGSAEGARAERGMEPAAAAQSAEEPTPSAGELTDAPAEGDLGEVPF